MTIPLVPATPAVDDASTISASTINSWRANMAKAVDGVGGSQGVASTPATEINIAGEGLKISGTGDAARLKYGTRSLTRAQGGFLYNNDTNDSGPYSIQIGAPAENGIQYLERIPNGATLTTITAYHDRVNLGTMPTTRVTLAVFKRDLTTGTITQLGTTTEDPTANLAAYELHHGFAVAIGSGGEVIDRTKCVYIAVFSGESGSFTSPTAWHGCTCSFSVTDQDEAP